MFESKISQKIKVYIKTTDIYSIELLIESGELETDENTINFSWTREEVQEFAKELLEGFPMKPIYYRRRGDYKLDIIDGQERLIALYLWYRGMYLKKGAEVNLKNIKNSQLKKLRII